MREIKFRAVKETGEIIYDVDIYHGGSPFEGTNDNPYEFKDGTLMQYTGLKDKNGTEIYEGDIVKTENGALYVVEWIDFGASFRYIDIDHMDSKVDSESMANYDNPEIIGNIYQNPELLK